MVKPFDPPTHHNTIIYIYIYIYIQHATVHITGARCSCAYELNEIPISIVTKIIVRDYNFQVTTVCLHDIIGQLIETLRCIFGKDGGVHNIYYFLGINAYHTLYKHFLQ